MMIKYYVSGKTVISGDRFSFFSKREKAVIDLLIIDAPRE